MMDSKKFHSTKAEWKHADPRTVDPDLSQTMPVRVCIRYLPNDLSFNKATMQPQ